MMRTFLDRLTRSPEDGAGAGEVQGTAPPAADAPAAPDYSWVPPAYLKDGQPDFAAFGSHYSELAAEAAARADAPKPPEAYNFALPEDFKIEGVTLPEGWSPKIATDDPDLAPLFTDLGAFLKDKGLPQDAATGLMGMLARYDAAREARAYQEFQSDRAKLGPTPAALEARMNKLANQIGSRLPADQAQALMAAVGTSAGIIALERLFSTGLGPAAPSPTPPPRDPLAARYPTNFSG